MAQGFQLARFAPFINKTTNIKRGCGQCDQIGQFFKVLVNNFSCQSGTNI